MKKTPLAQAGSVAEEPIRSQPRANPAVTFDLLSATRVDFGSKLGEATIEIPGLGRLDIDYFRPPGKPAFVTGRSIRAKHDGTFRRTIHLDEEFAGELLEAIEARFAADGAGDE